MKKNVLILGVLMIIGSFIFSGNQAKAQQQEAQLGTEVGNKAPEIMEKSKDGKILKLSDLKGSMF